MKLICYSVSFSLVLFSLSSCSKSSIPYTQNGDWVAESELTGPARSEAASFVINNIAYVGTGWDGLNTRYTDFWKYDPVANFWAQVASLPAVGRSSAVGFSIGTTGYLGTGYDGSNFLNDFYSYDPAGDSWTRKGDFAGSRRYEAVAFSIGNTGYLGTGFDGANALKDFYGYDPTLDLWTNIGFSGNKRYGAVTFVYNNKGYIVTGVNGSTLVSDFWVFNPAASDTAKWTQLRQITNYSTDSYDDGYSTITRWNGCAFVEGNLGYISTGQSASYNSFTWEYDFATDLWALKTPFEGPVTTGAVGFTLNSTKGGGGYIGTGRSANGQAGASDYLSQFFPDQVQNPNNN